MQIIKSEWPKAVIFLLAFFAIAFFSFYYGASGGSGPKPGIAPEMKPEDDYDQFYMNKLSLLKREGGKMVFSLSADKVFKRKRATKFFVYQNLKEICMSDVRIDVYPDNKRALTKKNTVAIPVDEIGKSIASMGKSTPVEEYLSGSSDLDLDLLSRFLLEKCDLDIHISSGKKLSISAAGAKINIDFQNIIFAGGIKVIDSAGNGISADEAVWSGKKGGLYMPNGYISKNVRYQGKAFFGINRVGELGQSLKVPDIEYSDPLEERENKVYADISAKMPGYAKLMFGMPQK